MHPYLYKDKFKFEVIVTGKFQNRGEFLIVYVGAQNSLLIRATLMYTIESQLGRGEGGQDIGLRRLKSKNGCNERSFIFCKQSKFNVKNKKKYQSK